MIPLARSGRTQRLPGRGVGSRGAGLAIAIGWALLAGCRALPPVEGLPEGRPLALDDARVVETLATHDAARTSRRALRGTARVSLRGPDYQLNRPQRIAVERPDRLRFEVLGLFDQLAAVLATDGDEYGFYDASSGEIARGRVSAALLWDLTKIDLTTAEVVDLLLGAPAGPDARGPIAAWLQPDGRLAIGFARERGAAPRDAREAALRLGRGGGRVLFFAPEGDLVELRSFEPGGGLRYRAYFEEYAALDAALEAEVGELFPRQVIIESPRVGAEARFAWKRVRLAPDLSDRIFRIPDPAGAGRDG